MKCERKSFAETLLGIAAATALFTAASAFWYVSHPSIQLSLDPRAPISTEVLTGFYAPEVTPEGLTFAWTNGDGHVVLRDPDRRTDWHVTVRLARGAWPPEAAPPTVTFEIDGRAARSETPQADFTNYELTVPRRPTTRGLDLALRSPTFVPGEHDSRHLGVVVSEVSLQPQGYVRQSMEAVAGAIASGASLALLCVMTGVGMFLTAALVTEFGLIYGWLLRFGVPPDSTHAVSPLLMAALICGVTAFTIAVDRMTVGRLSVAAERVESGLLLRFGTTLEIATQPLVLLTAVHLTVLALRVPLFGSLPWWFFGTLPSLKPLGPWYLIVALAALPFAAWTIVRRLHRVPRTAICLLVLLGFALQHGLAWSEGRGLSGMRDRIIASGHAEFAQAAVRQPRMWDVLVGYEAKLHRNELGDYARSKPPGQLLFYQATERIARALTHDPAEPARLLATYTLAAVAWPLLSYLAIFPLFFSLRALVSEETALLACVLYLVVPSVELLTLVTDQVLFPFLFMTTIWMATVAQQKRSWAWAFAAGASLYVSGFFTFALILSAPIAAGFAAAVEWNADSDQTRNARWRALAKTGLGLAAGFSALFLVFAVAFDYDFVERLRGAMLFHEQWKGWHGGLHDVFYFAWLDDLEFAVFLGVPLTVLTLDGMRRAILRRGTREIRTLAAPALALLGVFLYLSFFSHTKAETSRLWLPLVPMCCGLAAGHLQERDASIRGTMTAVVLALQWLTILLIKAGLNLR